MKKHFLSLLALTLMGAGSAFAQSEIVVGDMNDDGQLTVSDVTSLADAVVHPEKVRTLSIKCDPTASDPAAIAGHWILAGSAPLTLAADGSVKSCADARAKQFEYYPYGRLLVLLDAAGNIISDFIVVRKTADALVLQQLNGSYTSHEFVQLVETISLNYTRLQLQPGDSQRLTATVVPSNAKDATITWSSSNDGVAEVSKYGTVTVNGYGRCTITATANDGSGVKAECVVVVEKPHEYVDLGLPSGTLWATTNVGADNPEDYGYYFAWGEVDPKSTYNWSTCFDSVDGSSSNFKKYYNNGGKTELDLEDDAAYMNWGEGWRMPSVEQIDELCNSNYTTTLWTSRNGKNGHLITSKSNGASLFLPAGGYYDDSSRWNVGYNGGYWSRSLYTSGSFSACGLRFSSGSIVRSNNTRRFGQSVRPVRQN